LRGDVGRGLTVYTNDPVTPSVFLTIRARILSSVVIIPDRPLRIDNRRPEQNTNRFIVRKELTESGRLEIGELISSVPWLSATARRLDPEERLDGLPQPWPGDWLVELEVRGQPSYGRSDQSLRFASGLPREPEVEFPVLVHLFPPVNLSTEKLVLEPAAGGGVRSGSVLVSVRRDLDHAALGVEADPAEIAVRLESAGGRHYRLLVEWPEGSEAPAAREGTIRFDLGQESYRLPVLLAP